MHGVYGWRTRCPPHRGPWTEKGFVETFDSRVHSLEWWREEESKVHTQWEPLWIENDEEEKRTFAHNKNVHGRGSGQWRNGIRWVPRHDCSRRCRWVRGRRNERVHEMDTLIYSTPHQDVKELTRYLGDLNWMGHGSAYDENEGRPRKRVSVLGTLRTMGRPFTGSQFHARNEEHKVPSSFRRTEHAQRTNSPTVVRKQHWHLFRLKSTTYGLSVHFVSACQCVHWQKSMTLFPFKINNLSLKNRLSVLSVLI